MARSSLVVSPRQPSAGSEMITSPSSKCSSAILGSLPARRGISVITTWKSASPSRDHARTASTSRLLSGRRGMVLSRRTSW